MKRYKLVLLTQVAHARLANENVCGGISEVEGADKTIGGFTYDLKIVATHLDPDGFVLDNRIVEDLRDRYVDRTYVASCELLAGGLIREIAQLPATRGKLVSIMARVYNLTGYVEVTWVYGATFPDGPRAATDADWEKVKADRAAGKPRRIC